MTNNLGMSHDMPLSDDAFADACRQVGVGLAGLALAITGGDTEAAKGMLRGPLEAIGALPYQPGAGKYHYGQPPRGDAA